MSRIITIGREFGSGGREIGKRLSDELGIAYYDNEIISQIADRTKLAEGYVQHVMENGPSTLYPITIGRSFYMGVDPIMEQNPTVSSSEEAPIIFCARSIRSACLSMRRWSTRWNAARSARRRANTLRTRN